MYIVCIRKSELETVEGAAKRSVEIVFPTSWDFKAVSKDSEYQLVEVGYKPLKNDDLKLPKEKGYGHLKV